VCLDSLVTPHSADSDAGYWYPHDDARRRGVDVLSAMRRYRAAEQAMRRRTRGSMGMGETDLLALRILLEARTHDRIVTAKELSQRLDISSASTTVLIDRLEKSGHVARGPHPTDRRAVVVTATAASDHEVRETLGRMHSGMLEVAEGLTPEDADAVVAFLDGLREVVERIESDERTA
jgi:DNA-binding MarR family transcriptional regulator